MKAAVCNRRHPGHRCCPRWSGHQLERLTDGDMADYMANLRRRLDRDDEIYWPTHGPAITDPKTYLQALIAHREEREVQILECLVRGVSRIEKMVPEIYVGLDPRLFPAAGRSVFSHLVKLVEEGRATADGANSIDTEYSVG